MLFFIGLFLSTFQVACDAAPRGSFPALPAEIRFGRLSKYQVEKRQVSLPTPTSLLPVCTPEQLTESPSCPGYKALGWCEITGNIFIAALMTNCLFTCGRCREPPPTPPATTAPPVCIADISASCAGYKVLGLCDFADTSSFFFSFLVQNCNATCGECEPPTTMAPTTKLLSAMTAPLTMQSPTESLSTIATPSTMASPTESLSPSSAASPTESLSTMALPSTVASSTESLSTMVPQSTGAPPSESSSSMAPPSTTESPTESLLTMAPTSTVTFPTESLSAMAPASTAAPPTKSPSSMAQPSTTASQTEPLSTMAPPSTAVPPTESPSSMAPPSTTASPTEPLSTMAPTSTMAPPTEPPSTIPTLTPQDAACLQAHNAKRAIHGSPPLAWSDVLAQNAQAWADHLAATETFVHEQGIVEGENLYWARASTARNCSDAVESWYSEELLYDYDRPPQTIPEFLEADIGHFTQVVWKGTTMVGAAVKTVVGGFPPIQTYIVARYAPPGNIIGQFSENVVPPVVRTK